MNATWVVSSDHFKHKSHSSAQSSHKHKRYITAVIMGIDPINACRCSLNHPFLIFPGVWGAGAPKKALPTFVHIVLVHERCSQLIPTEANESTGKGSICTFSYRYLETQLVQSCKFDESQSIMIFWWPTSISTGSTASEINNATLKFDLLSLPDIFIPTSSIKRYHHKHSNPSPPSSSSNHH